MAKEGNHACFFYASAYKMANQKTWYPFYDADLGEPKGDYEARDGGFLRVFSRGCVAVNPTDKPVTLSLPQPYTTLAGQELVKLSLPPKRGAVLLAPAKGGGSPSRGN
jgi:hypothetical protein